MYKTFRTVNKKHVVEIENNHRCRVPAGFACVGDVITIILTESTREALQFTVEGHSETSIVIPKQDFAIMPRCGEMALVHVSTPGGEAPLPLRNGCAWWRKIIVDEIRSVEEGVVLHAMYEGVKTIDLANSDVIVVDVPVIGYDDTIDEDEIKLTSSVWSVLGYLSGACYARAERERR